MRPVALVAAIAIGVASCAKAPPAPATARAPVHAAPGTWSYEVTKTGGVLDVEATFPPGVTTFAVEDSATPFLGDVTVEGAGLPPVQGSHGVWTLDACAAGCKVRYRYRLEDAAHTLEDIDTAMHMSGCVEAPPSTWLLRPTDAPEGTRYRFHVQMPAGELFATGVRPIAQTPDTYGSEAMDVDAAPYTLFGPFRVHALHRGTATIEVATFRHPMALSEAELDHWIDISAGAVTSYYGRFPVEHLLLLVAPSTGGHGEEVEGRTLASGGASILLGVNAEMQAKDVPKDWVLTHELTHLALPTLRRQFHWLEEGTATYVEPLARAQVGALSPEDVWSGVVHGVPNGEPLDGDEGLDRTHTWGRTYWGGALFCLVADVEIRKATGGKKSLQDALAGVLAAGGNGEVRWSIESVMQEADRAVGLPVLSKLYAEWGTSPVKVDLPKLWRELGVREDGGKVAFDETAPLAAMRRAMTARK